MTDAGWLTIVLVLVYLVECFEILPMQSILLVSKGAKKGRIRRPFLILPGLQKAIHLSNPASLLAKEYQILNARLIDSISNLVLLVDVGYGVQYANLRRDQSSGDRQSSDTVLQSWLEEQLLESQWENGSDAKVQTTRFTRRSALRVRRMQVLLNGRLQFLTQIAVLQALVILLCLPALMFTKGILRGAMTIGPIIAVLQMIIGIELYQLRRRYFREPRLVTILQLTPHLLFPPSALRSGVTFGRHWLRRFHPVLVIFECTRPAIANAEFDRYARWLIYSSRKALLESTLAEDNREIVLAWRKQETRDLHEYLAVDGGVLARVLDSNAPAVTGPYCPVCLSSYEDHLRVCEECYGVRLQRRRN